MTTVLALCVGACVGALLRWQLALMWNPAGAVLPWGTLAANWLGGFGVGLVIGVLEQHPQLDPLWRVALVTGFLGALTTFSSFSAEGVALLSQGRYALALGHASLHLLGSLALTALGLKTAQVLF